MKIFDVRDVPLATDAQLAVVDNPRHQHMLKNFRRHGILEVSGLWPQILDPVMTVEHPLYKMFEGGRYHVFDGMDAVKGFYSAITDGEVNVFGPIEEHVAVSDHGIFTEAIFARVVRGDSPFLTPEDGVEADGIYQITNHIAMAWPYEKGRLQGEHVWENNLSREVHEVGDASYLISPEQARERLAPLLAQSPLDDIVEGLKLFADD